MHSPATNRTHGHAATPRQLLLCHPERAHSLPLTGPIVLQTMPLLRMLEGEAPHPRPGNPCRVCLEVNDENVNPLRGHDLGCGSTERLHWLCSPCIANQDEDLRPHTLRTLIQQNVWNNGAREDSPDNEWLDVLTDEDPVTPPPRRPWRAPT